jgi:hypothetical protein
MSCCFATNLRTSHRRTSQLSLAILRWQIVLHALPFAFVTVVFRFAAWNDWIPAFFAVHIDSNCITLAITASTFVCTFLLNGALADFKEAEKVPGDLEVAFQNIFAALQSHAAVQPSFSLYRPLVMLRDCLDAVISTLDDSVRYRISSSKLRAAEVALTSNVTESKGPASTISSNLGVIRSKMSRVEVIARTSFLLPAYALFDTITVLLSALLVLYTASSPEVGYVTAGLFSFLFNYM